MKLVRPRTQKVLIGLNVLRDLKLHILNIFQNWAQSLLNHESKKCYVWLGNVCHFFSFFVVKGGCNI